jgi:hypothetical protein
MSKHQSEAEKKEMKIIQGIQANQRKLEVIESQLGIHGREYKTINVQMQLFLSELSQLNDSFNES